MVTEQFGREHHVRCACMSAVSAVLLLLLLNRRVSHQSAAVQYIAIISVIMAVDHVGTVGASSWPIILHQSLESGELHQLLRANQKHKIRGQVISSYMCVCSVDMLF